MEKRARSRTLHTDANFIRSEQFLARRGNFSRGLLISSGYLLSRGRGNHSSVIRGTIVINRETDMIYSVTPYRTRRDRNRTSEICARHTKRQRKMKGAQSRSSVFPRAENQDESEKGTSRHAFCFSAHSAPTRELFHTATKLKIFLRE